MSRCCRCLILAASLAAAFGADCTAADMEWVAISQDRQGFVLADSGKPFIPWGFNYDHEGDGKLLEDYWDAQWPTVESAFREMKDLGANVVRIHLQFGAFMASPTQPRQSSLDRLARLVKLAERTGLYLDLTGLGCYHKPDTPPWYDALSEQERWKAQAAFWRAVATTCAESPAILCYDLMNEPVVPGGDKKRSDWLGPGFGGKHFTQFIALDRAGRRRPDIARRWIHTLVAAIRKHDKRRLVTVGLVPWSLDRPGLTSGFVPEKIAGELDFIAMHIYPEQGKVDEAIETLKGFAAVGKPVVIEEIFPLKCDANELGRFIDASQRYATGWIGFYWGATPAEYRRRPRTIQGAIALSWLELFQRKTPRLLGRRATPGAFLHNGVTAHRGNSAEHPENTIPAFESGMEVGADWIELDIFRTKDGKLVVIHDRTTARTGDKNLSVPDSSYEELLSVDVAADFRRRTGKTIEECPVQRIPLLDEVLHLVMKQDRARVSIQPKMDCVAEAVALVKLLKAQRWVGFNDGSLDLMAAVKRLAPEIPVFWDRGAAAEIDQDIRLAKQHGFEALVLHQSGVTPEKVRKIKAAGLEAGAWTVNDPATMEKLLESGVERLYTDRPGTLLALKTARRFHNVACEGTYKRHLQGVCTDAEAIYWSFTTTLVKTDLNGKLLKQAPVANHHGDLCLRDGKLYVAVNLGRFNDPQGHADSWVYVYDAQTLKELARHETQEVFHGAGGVGVRNGRFFVVGGLPDGVEENYVYEYDGRFKFLKKHVVKSGHTLLGIQTAAFANDRWWFGCYGDPKILLVTDAKFNMLGRYEFDCSLGIASVGARRFLVGRGACSKQRGCAGRLVVAEADDQRGLIERKAAGVSANRAP